MMNMEDKIRLMYPALLVLIVSVMILNLTSCTFTTNQCNQDQLNAVTASVIEIQMNRTVNTVVNNDL